MYRDLIRGISDLNVLYPLRLFKNQGLYPTADIWILAQILKIIEEIAELAVLSSIFESNLIKDQSGFA